MPANTRGDKPADVSLNLDTLEREGGDEPKPFVVVLGGERFEFVDLDTEDWQTVADIDEDDPREALKMLLGEDWPKFSAHKLPLWKLRRLLDAWREHTTGADSGEDSGSSVS